MHCLSSLLLIVLTTASCHGAKFSATGPVVTLTLKDPTVSNSDKPWLDLSQLRPSLEWKLQSQQPPLPNWFPALSGVQVALGYDYNKTIPTWIQAAFRLVQGPYELLLQPTLHHHPNKKNNALLLQARRGASSLTARMEGFRLQAAQASLHVPLPFASVQSLRIQPSTDGGLVLEASSPRTQAVLDLQPSQPSLTLIHALDDHHVLAPSLNLYTAQLVYQWQWKLPNGRLCTQVDPSRDIQVQWTDVTSNGQWKTHLRLPLVGASVQTLAAQVSVQRQFVF